MFLNLREYSAEDKDSIIDLDEAALADLDASGLPRKFDDLRNLEEEYLKNGAFVVAESEDGIVGMGGIRFSTSGDARINRMRVHPSKQGAGIGKAILTWLEEKAASKAITKIVLNTLSIQEKAQRFYESFGYEKVGEGSPDGFAVFMYEKQVKPEHNN